MPFFLFLFHQLYGSDEYFTNYSLRACGNFRFIASVKVRLTERVDTSWMIVERGKRCGFFVEEVEGVVFKNK